MKNIKFAALMMGLVFLFGCSNATNSTDNNLSTIDVSETTELITLPETQAGCLALDLATQADVIACLQGVTARDSESLDAIIADLDRQLAEDAKIIAENERELEERRTTISALEKVVAIQEEKSPN